MFAGHMILLVFTLGGFALLGATSWFIKPISLVSWAMAIALTFLEALVIVLQAYVFVVLTSSYVSVPSPRSTDQPHWRPPSVIPREGHAR